MDYALRCSIIFVAFYVIYTSYGVNAVVRSKFDRVSRLQNQLNKPYENVLPWQQVRNDPFQFQRDLNNYDFDDYNQDGEVQEHTFQFSNENTQRVANDDYDQDEEDESLSSDELISSSIHVDKRGHQHLDLCPMHERRYKLRGDWRRLRVWEFHFNYTERVCNHTTTSLNYDRQYNRICDSIGKTFEHGHGTHCFQRFTSKNIEVKNTNNGKKTHYTEENFKDGCSCGWAINELGAIKEYHDGKILNLCKDIRNML